MSYKSVLASLLKIWHVAVIAFAVLLAASGDARAAGETKTVAGGDAGDGSSPAVAALQPRDIAVSGGDLFIADIGTCRIRKLSGGNISTLAGNSACAMQGDGGAATSASLRPPQGVAVDATGRVYATDVAAGGGGRVRSILDGVISTFAGNGNIGYCGDGGPATDACLYGPAGMANDAAGKLYVAESANCRIRKVSGLITTLAGNGVCGFGGDDGLATSASLDQPEDVVVDSGGNLYIADKQNCRVRKVSGSGFIATFAGGSGCGFSGDGGPATSALLAYPSGVAVDAAGNVFISDTNNCRVRKVAAGTITTVAGDGTCSFGGDGGPATTAQLASPWGIATDGLGNLYIADQGNCRVRRVDGAGVISTVAGGDQCTIFGDGGAATSASLSAPPRGIASSGSGIVYVIHECVVRRVEVGGAIARVAGGGTAAPGYCGFSGDGGSALAASLNGPLDVSADSNGDIYIADAGNHRIRRVSGGVITTVAGNGTPGFSGDGGPATNAQLNHPTGLTVSGTGDLYIADWGNCRVRKVSGGTISTVAGSGTCQSTGDGGPATSAGLRWLWDVAVDGAGQVFISEFLDCRVRKVLTSGIIVTAVGTGVCDHTGDGGAASSARLYYPSSLAMTGAGGLLIAEGAGDSNCYVRRVSGTTIATLVGSATCGFTGDGGAAASAQIGFVGGVATDVDGVVYLATNSRLRMVASGAVGGIAGLPQVAGPALVQQRSRAGQSRELLAFGAIALIVVVSAARLALALRKPT